MKKTIRLIAALIVIFISANAYAQEKTKVAYEFPEAMREDIKVKYAELADKGLALYQITCAKCHGKKVKGKEFIPDFTPEQLEAYQVRIANAKHETELKDEVLSAEELSLITIFFAYKKKNEQSKKDKANKATESNKNKVAAH